MHHRSGSGNTNGGSSIFHSLFLPPYTTSFNRRHPLLVGVADLLEAPKFEAPPERRLVQERPMHNPSRAELRKRSGGSSLRGGRDRFPEDRPALLESGQTLQGQVPAPLPLASHRTCPSLGEECLPPCPELFGARPRCESSRVLPRRTDAAGSTNQS